MNTKFEEHQLCGSNQCPGCGHKFQAKPDWVGLPAGVKFDPTDQELIEHLEAKAEAREDAKSHPLIDEFIPTIEGEDGICYTHPEKLPGVTRDGLSRHFFHRPSKAYTTGTRKRRKIQNESRNILGSTTGETRWHKTGKTRPVLVNGTQKGCKKILVLYTNFGKNRKPEKTNWVMHQYHLGINEEEKEGELVVSKIFYQTQPRQCNMLSEHRTNVVSNACEGRDSCSSKEISINNYAAAAMDHHHRHSGFLAYNDNRQISSSSNYMVNDHNQHRNLASSTVLPVSSIISPSLLQQQTAITVDENSYHVAPGIMVQNQCFEQQDHHHHHKPEARSGSGSGLEDLIMSCSSNYIKEESSTPNPQEADWSKFSTFWPDLDNQDPHG